MVTNLTATTRLSVASSLLPRTSEVFLYFTYGQNVEHFPFLIVKSYIRRR